MRTIMSGRRWVVLTGLLFATVPAIAHHASTPFYDDTKMAEAQGTVTKFLIRNPHSFLYFEATDAKGQTVEWQVELGAASSMARTGWTAETIKPGLVIKAVGRPSRAEGSHGMCCARITRPDGSPIVAGARVAEEQQPPR
jgi:Family of unknown function (DUF6152)